MSFQLYTLGDMLSNLIPDFDPQWQNRPRNHGANGNANRSSSQHPGPGRTNPNNNTTSGLTRDDVINSSLFGPVPPPGLTENQIKELPKFSFDPAQASNMFDCCTICYFQFAENEVIRKLPCGHMFHSRCIKPWLRNNPDCP